MPSDENLNEYLKEVLAGIESELEKKDIRDKSFKGLSLMRGLILSQLGRNAEALECFNNVIEMHPEHGVAYLFRSQFYFVKYKLDLAMQDIDMAIQLKGTCPQNYFHKGEIYRKLKNCEEAIKEYTKAIELDPSYYEALVERGYLYNAKGEEEKSRSDLALAAKLKREKGGKGSKGKV